MWGPRVSSAEPRPPPASTALGVPDALRGHAHLAFARGCKAGQRHALQSSYAWLMAEFEALVDELERSYRETQERMSDPAVFNDHRQAADVGRRLKELEGPAKLAGEWRRTSADLADARSDGDLRELVPELEARLAELEEELKLALVEADPADRKD